MSAQRSMQDVHLQSEQKPWLSWNTYYKRGGVYVVWGVYGEAYVGLSRNISARLNQHNDDAKSKSHPNGKFQEMYNDANGKLSYSVVWLSKTNWDSGGNYEASLIERYVIKELANSWSTKVINETQGGEVGGKGYKAVPVKITNIFGVEHSFKSIKACSVFLRCSTNKVKKAAERNTYIGLWKVSITDNLYHRRKKIKKSYADQDQGCLPVLILIVVSASVLSIIF